MPKTQRAGGGTGALEFTDLAPPSKFPRLSEQLFFHPRGPGCCQKCGGGEELQLWVEHDDADLPTRTLVCLCAGCADRSIGPHPRLYDYLERNMPRPGAMALCVECRHRREFDCQSPLADWNGGVGLEIEQEAAIRVHILARGGRRKNSGWVTFYPEPPRACSGREQS